MNELKIEDYREHYNLYFKEFHRLAVGEFADLSYGTDKPNDTASSLESIIAYSNYILQTTGDFNYIKILNAGSGASTWMFRKIFENKVVDIDSNVHYQQLIKKICGGNDSGFEMTGFSRGFQQFDHVFYDYGSIERLPYLGYAISYSRYSAYIDDADNRECCIPYRTHVQELCKAMELKCFDCTDALDEHGRFGVIIEK